MPRLSTLLVLLASITFLPATGDDRIGRPTTPAGGVQTGQLPPVAQQTVSAERYFSPFDAVRLAEADITAIELLGDKSIDPQYCRYLSLHNMHKVDRAARKKTIDYVINSLNPRYYKIIRTATVPLGDDPIVVRINLKDYNIDPAAWDELAENGSGPNPLPDPYFHLVAIKTVDVFKEEKYDERIRHPGGLFEGRSLAPGDYTIPRVRQVKVSTKTEKVLATAPWIELEDDEELAGSTINSLMAKTGTKNPILLADWFITNATWPPAYYRLIGLKKKKLVDGKEGFLEGDLEALAKVDLKLTEEELVAAVADTKIVTLHNRIIERRPTVAGIKAGYYWRSRDTDSGLGDEDYMANVHTFKNPKIKAQEIIFSGRNGLNFFALTNNARVLLDVAAASIAQHGDVIPTKWQDKQVYPSRNCMLCHSSGQIPINDKVRGLAQGYIGLLTSTKNTDPELKKQLDEAFSPNLLDIINHDNAKYAVAVRACNGLDTKVNGQLFEDTVNDYYYKVVTLNKAALEAGIEPDKLIVALREGVNMFYTGPAFLQNPAQDISRLPWESRGYADLMLYLMVWKEKHKK